MCIRDSHRHRARSLLDAVEIFRRSPSTSAPQRERLGIQEFGEPANSGNPVSYTHLRAHETSAHL
eukprot:5433548-Alexandrium_andersonii.AAC.1